MSTTPPPSTPPSTPPSAQALSSAALLTTAPALIQSASAASSSSRAKWSTEQLELLVDAVSEKRVWTAPHGTTTRVWEEITAIVTADWPAGIKQPDSKGVYAKYKEMAERAKRKQASASGRSGEHDESEETWTRTLIDNIEQQQEYETQVRISKEEKEEKEKETARRHTQLRDDAMRTLKDKKEREDKRDRGESSGSSDSKRPRTDTRSLLQQLLTQTGDLKTAVTQSSALISGSMDRTNNLLAIYLKVDEKVDEKKNQQ